MTEDLGRLEASRPCTRCKISDLKLLIVLDLFGNDDDFKHGLAHDAMDADDGVARFH
jgi:hypothetical protein